jgi:hypothetical protein
MASAWRQARVMIGHARPAEGAQHRPYLDLPGAL